MSEMTLDKIRDKLNHDFVSANSLLGLAVGNFDDCLEAVDSFFLSELSTTTKLTAISWITKHPYFRFYTCTSERDRNYTEVMEEAHKYFDANSDLFTDTEKTPSNFKRKDVIIIGLVLLYNRETASFNWEYAWYRVPPKFKVCDPFTEDNISLSEFMSLLANIQRNREDNLPDAAGM